MSELVPIGGLWKNKDKNGNDYFSGNFTYKTKLLVMTNTFKDKEKYTPIIEKGLRWLIDIKNEQGWGDFPEEPSNLERTADGLDTLLKYRRYCSGKPMSDFWAFSK